MDIPGVSGPVHPGSPGHGLAWTVVTIRSVEPERNLAVAVDQMTKEYRLPLNSRRPKGFPPEEGEQWIISREYGGPWAFVLLINGRVGGETVSQEQVRDLDTGVAQGDGQLYGDLLSTMHRREIRTSVAVGNGVLHLYRLYPTRSLDARLVKWAIGGTGRVGGVHHLCVYGGTDPANLVLLSSGPASGSFNSTVPNSIQVHDMGSTHRFPARSHILLGSWVTGSTTPPAFGGIGGVLGASMINRVEAPVSVQKTVAAVPPSVNLVDGSWTTGTTIVWCALSMA